MNQKIELFLRENNIDPPLKNLQEPEESSQMLSTKDHIMARQRVAEIFYWSRMLLVMHRIPMFLLKPCHTGYYLREQLKTPLIW